VTWNKKSGEQCCRTCLSSSGISHGPDCAARTKVLVPSKKRPTTFYHATNLKAALTIQEGGFRVPLGTGGCLGPGIYCTTSLKKAFDYLKCRDGGVIFELRIDLGRCKTLAANDPMMKTWQQNDFDSAWHRTGAVNSVGKEKEENCIKDPSRIRIVRPIPGHTGKLLEVGYDVIGDKLVILK